MLKSLAKCIENSGYFNVFPDLKFGRKVDFGQSLLSNRIIQFGRGWQTSRLYSEPYWAIFELLDPQILRS